MSDYLRKLLPNADKFILEKGYGGTKSNTDLGAYKELLNFIRRELAEQIKLGIENDDIDVFAQPHEILEKGFAMLIEKLRDPNSAERKELNKILDALNIRSTAGPNEEDLVTDNFIDALEKDFNNIVQNVRKEDNKKKVIDKMKELVG